MTSAEAPPVVGEAVRAHRLGYWEWIAANAVPRDRDTLLRLRDHWRDCNARYFGGVMCEPYITLTEPSKPGLLGQCCPVSSWGSRLEIRIRPSLLAGTHPAMAAGSASAEGRYLFAADVLLHETVHQWQMEITGAREASYHGHGPGFAGKANDIGAALGLPAVAVRNRGGSREMVCANWPHNVRDPAHYLGAWQPSEPVPDTGDTCPHLRRHRAVASVMTASVSGQAAAPSVAAARRGRASASRIAARPPATAQPRTGPGPHAQPAAYPARPTYPRWPLAAAARGGGSPVPDDPGPAPWRSPVSGVAPRVSPRAGHTTPPGGPESWTPCPARARLTTGELASLAAVPHGCHVLEGAGRACELEARHPGPHLAAGQSYSSPFGPFERWISWNAGSREIVTFRAMCETEFPSPVISWDTEPCPLPAGHAGRCSPALVGPAEREIASLGHAGGEVPDGPA